jgi:long-chain acyl-CoA synthetase
LDWSQHSIPAMRLETRFGDRVVPTFCDRPGSLWAMIAEAAARNPDAEALICGERRLRWREVAGQSARICSRVSAARPAARRPYRGAARQPH